jgi:hypothetical protein
VDILIERSPENVARLLDTLSGFGEGHVRDLTAADFDEAEGPIRIIEDFSTRRVHRNARQAVCRPDSFGQAGAHQRRGGELP